MTAHFPASVWAGHAGLAELLQILGAAVGDTRFVGGVVRDALLGQHAHDIDLATRLTPDIVAARLTAAQVRHVPTGLAHGTLTAVLADGSVEITTLRRDVSTDGRRATIAFTDDWREDAARRDFTINALSADPRDGTVYDYFGGLDDLAARRVRFIGDALTRIAEDHLRILRYFRFHARFGAASPDAPTLAACAMRANDLMALSRERIADELLKILALPDPRSVAALMLTTGIFVPVVPEITSCTVLDALIATEHMAGVRPDAVRRLAALLPRDPVRAEAVGARLKLSRQQRRELSVMAARTPEDTRAPRALAYRVGQQLAINRLLLLGAHPGTLSDWVVPVFPVKGGDLIARGVSAGPEVAATLRSIESAWVATGFPTGAALDALIEQALPPDVTQV